MSYFRRPWDETRGDERDAWGLSVWYFETDSDGNVIRQIEAYDHGPTLRYGPGREVDEFGQLSDQPIDTIEFAEFEIPADDFHRAWLNQGE
jgi:hypothetical protein